jgi:hypothetical protein
MNFRSRTIDLHIIDAPSQRYGKAGASEAVALQYRLKDTDINIVSHIAWDQKSLQRRFSNILKFRKSYRSPRKALPFIHIAAGHGISDGLLIGRNVPIGWSALNEMLCEINETTGNNLLLGLSSCHGLYGYRMACITEQKPFHLLIAPWRARTTRQLVMGFARVYRGLLHDFTSVKQAIEHANRVPHKDGKLLEALYGWEVRKAHKLVGYDDPKKLMKRGKTAQTA